VGFAYAELTDAAACKKAVQEVLDQYGVIDGLVNNAGVNDGVSLAEGDFETFTQSLHKNLTHYFMMAHYCLPCLKKIQRSYCKYRFKNSCNWTGRNLRLCSCKRWEECTHP
jgi:NAD(P)-dependent dehydrogenase (short-subunit alcohol dehydrogenase family)